MEWLIADARARAPEGAYVTLIGDLSGHSLYRSLGFQGVAPSLGMALPWTDAPESMPVAA